MDQLKFWKSGDSDRNYSFLYSGPSHSKSGAWMCTLTVHDGYRSDGFTLPGGNVNRTYNTLPWYYSYQDE
jgi:hypothetical protein